MSQSSENSLMDTLVNCLSQQLSEFELLKSMYPNNDEIILSDNNILKDINNFLENKLDYSPSHLDFILNLVINCLKLEVCINLPSFYPNEEPDIYIRCNQMNRQQETSLNTELSNYIKNNHLGEVCLYTVISWLQENIDVFSTKVIDEVNIKVQNNDNEQVKKETFVRLWVFSHHIYNKKKREEIVSKAKDLNLTGFCIPGKPGIICIEGLDSYCKDWWKDIKSLNWKKIAIRKTETFEQSEQTEQQKFVTFEELNFQSTTSRHNKHVDMSEFSKFMEQHGLAQVFKDIFGLYNDI